MRREPDKTRFYGPLKPPTVPLRVTRPEVVVLRDAERPAAADVRELGQLASERLGVFVPGARVLEGTGKVRGTIGP